MIDIYVVRHAYLKDCTLGTILDSNGQPICSSLEKPWEGNQANISCVPPADYPIFKDIRHRGRDSEIEVWELREVPGRSQIQFHIANYPSQLLGCLATVTNLVKIDDKVMGTSSRDAFERFMARIGSKTEGIVSIQDRPYRSQDVGLVD